MGKNNSFQRTWTNQTEVGRLFGLSAIKVGKILTELGYKDANGATMKATAAGLAKYTPLKDGSPHWMWHKKNTARILSNAGLQRKSNEDVRKSKQESEARRIAGEITRLFNAGEDKIAYLMLDSLWKEDKQLYDLVSSKIKE